MKMHQERLELASARFIQYATPAYIEYTNNKDPTAYYNAIRNSSILQIMDCLVTAINSNVETEKLLNVYYTTSIDLPQEMPLSVCVCGGTYTTDAQTSSRTCIMCGYTETLTGTVLEDSQFFYQEGHRGKKTSYVSSKYGRAWIDRIQGRASIDLTQVIDKVKTTLLNERVPFSTVNYSIIRDYLKKLKLSKYNKHVPLICKEISGKPVAELTPTEETQLSQYFDEVIQVYNNIKSNDKPNSLYHPFFIYKLIEQIVPSNDVERKTLLLSAIHLQSPETLRVNDKQWYLILEHFPQFTANPTIR